ncbi:MAG: flavin reductase family protein [Solirubrobacterales bacterium]
MSARPDPEHFREVLASYPTGVTVVTATGPDGPSGMTANSVTSLSLDPLLMLVCFARTARTLDAARHAGRFGINVLATGQAGIARRFAGKQPNPEKWRDQDWTERAGSPALAGTAAWIACELRETIEGGDHLIVTGEVTEVDGSDEDPLLWHLGDFRTIG